MVASAARRNLRSRPPSRPAGGEDLPPTAAAGGLHRRYDASPEDCFNTIAGAVAELAEQIDELDQVVESLEGLFDRLVEAAATRPVAAPATEWIYDAQQPNLHFADLHAMDDKSGAGRRWVGSSGVLAARLSLPRLLQYSFSVEGVAFARPEYEKGFHLRVGDRRYTWLRAEGGVYETLILEDPAARDLRFELGITLDDAATDDVTFSLSRLAIRRRG